jgi:hypothetical protein
MKIRSSVQTLAALLVLGISHTAWAQSADKGILGLGDAVVTGFSGVVEPNEEPPKGQDVLDETFINPEGISARITPLSAPGFKWDARVWTPLSSREFKAADIGQVFGVAMDNERHPNIYVTATSNYGLHIVEPDQDNDTRPERLKQGKASAAWMAGMWGTTDVNDPPGSIGGPGSIWKIDGETGDVSLFANVTLEGVANGGAGLGNIAFDRVHKQLFVSDLSTGMIHRFDLDGQELEVWDAGVTGFTAANETPVPYDPAGQLDITAKDFDSEDDATWGLTDKNRRVYGLAPHGGRLYYALVGQNQIWSVGIDEKTGAILGDARWEVDVPTKPNKLPVTDMLFTSQGAMVLAQRGNVESTYDYANFADPGRARVYRYWLETPEDDPATPSRWIPEPEEYAVGFEDENRATNGGIALNHGYTREGFIDRNVCEASIFTTADNLRRNDTLKDNLLPGGPMVIDGLQGMPTGPVKQYPPEKNNTPPWISYMVDTESTNTDQTLKTDDPLQWSDITTQGWIGDVAILRGCGGDAIAGYVGGGESGIGGGGGGYNGWPREYPYWTNYTNTGGGGGGGGGGTGGTGCIIGFNCPPPPPTQNCAKVVGKFVCDPKTGKYTFNGKITVGNGTNFDAVKFSNEAPGHTTVGGPIKPFANPSDIFAILGAFSGQTLGADLCLYNTAEMMSGKPFACCKVKFDEPAPLNACKKK